MPDSVACATVGSRRRPSHAARCNEFEYGGRPAKPFIIVIDGAWREYCRVGFPRGRWLFSGSQVGALLKRFERVLSRMVDGRTGAAVIALVLVLIHLAIAAAGGFAPLESELQRVSVSMAETGRIADAYREGSGPTTHTGPLAPALAAGVYWALGPASAASEIVLTIISALVVAATALVLNATFKRLGTPAWARGAALLFIVLVPIHASLQAQDLRARESGIAALMLASTIFLAVRADQQGKVSWTLVGVLAALAAVLFMLSPASGLGAYGVCGLLCLRRIDWRRWLGVVLVAAGALAIVTTPWALRNQRVFGEPILSRGNFGLEFAIGTHAGAVAPSDPTAAFQARLREIHPFRSEFAYANMQAAGGEIPYARKLQLETNAWISGHRSEAARIWARHILEFYAPPPWLWNPYAQPGLASKAKSVIVGILTLVALIALAIRLFQRQWMYLYIMFPVVLVSLPYVALQPRVRYRYVIASLLVFLAVDIARRRSKYNTEPDAAGLGAP